MTFRIYSKRGILLISLFLMTLTCFYIYEYSGLKIKTVDSGTNGKTEHSLRNSKVVDDFKNNRLQTHSRPSGSNRSQGSKYVIDTHEQLSRSYSSGGSEYVVDVHSQPSRLQRSRSQGSNHVTDAHSQPARSQRSRPDVSNHVTDAHSQLARSQRSRPDVSNHVTDAHYQPSRSQRSRPDVSNHVTDAHSQPSHSHRSRSQGSNYPIDTHSQLSRLERLRRSKYVIKVVHQSWKSKDLPPRFQLWSQSWRTCYPEWEHRLWTDDDNRRLIEEHYPWFLERYNSLPKEIYRADAARYFYMYHYGGIYADLDAECLRPFEHLLANSSVVFGAMAGQYHSNIPEGYTQNSFMYSRRKHPFWKEVMDEILDRANGSPEATTGPIMLGNVIQRYRKEHPAKDFIIYPPLFFNPFSWIHNDVKVCKDLNKMSSKELLLCRETHRERGAYVIQYHVNTWSRGQIL